MNGRAAKTDRRVRRLQEALVQAHDRLHKDDVDACHEVLHAALGAGEAMTDVAPLAHRSAFDAAFRSLCIAKGVRAAYVLIDSADGDRARVLTGGDAHLCHVVDASLRRSPSADPPPIRGCKVKRPPKRRPKVACRGHKGKRRFHDKPQAVASLHAIASSDHRRETYPVRAYFCEFCKGWFLTSEPSR